VPPWFSSCVMSTTTSGLAAGQRFGPALEKQVRLTRASTLPYCSSRWFAVTAQSDCSACASSQAL